MHFETPRDSRARALAMVLWLGLALTVGCRSETPAPEGSGALAAAPTQPADAQSPPGTGEGSAVSAEESPPIASAPETAPSSEPTLEPPDEVASARVLEGLELDLAAMTLDAELGRYVVPLENGQRVVLTLDPALQDHLATVVRRYDEPAEAVVAVEPATGRVLAWVEDHNDRLEVEHPAASADPWAASVFKVVSASILVQERNLGLGRRMCVPPGRGELDEQDLVANEARDTRCVAFTEALAESVNAYFGRLFLDELTPELIEAWLLRFGFNQVIPFELPVAPSLAEVPGNHLERARMGAGFRHSHLSPLHAALLVATIANDGVMMRPTLVDRVLGPDGEVLAERRPETWIQVMTPATAHTMTQAMSTTTTTGTAARHFAQREGWPHDLRVAGKTGTLSNRTSEGSGDPGNVLIYSWFVGFAPIESPSIAVAGLVYNSERWYIKGSYLGSEAILQYLRR